jgi:hypothetical protein
MKRIALASASVTLAGCMVNPVYLPEKYSTAHLTDGRLSISIAPEKYEQLGGKQTSELSSFVASVVARERVCPEGFTAAEPMPVRGYVHILVRCKGKGT